MKIKPIFAWFDLWVGVFIDLPKARVYIFPLPTLGLRIDWKRKCARCGHRFYATGLYDYCGRGHCWKCKRQEEYFDENYA